MTFCICCLISTEAQCRACNVSVCPECLEDGLCPVCERLALHRRERALFTKQWNQPTVKLPALPTIEKHWTAKLTRELLAELPTEPANYETVEMMEA